MRRSRPFRQRRRRRRSRAKPTGSPRTPHPRSGPRRAMHPGDSERERAIELGYRAVGYRDCTVAELRTFLERKRVEPEAIADAVAELTAAGVLDDARYARRFAEDKRDL